MQLEIRNDSLKIQQGKILFPEQEELKTQAQEILDHLSKIEVTPENVADNKKLISTVNKAIKGLEDRRISIKKEMLEPYNEFEKQVKEIVGIVKEADSLVRTQIHELEEAEREDKQHKIYQIFNKRIKAYDFGDAFTFEDFFQPMYLNKSVSMIKVEQEMVNWLEGIDRDLQVINSLEDRVDILAEYVSCIDLAKSIEAVNKRKEVKKRNEVLNHTDTATADNVTYVFIINNEKDAKLLELLMKENDIKYEKRNN